MRRYFEYNFDETHRGVEIFVDVLVVVGWGGGGGGQSKEYVVGI